MFSTAISLVRQNAALCGILTPCRTQVYFRTSCINLKCSSLSCIPKGKQFGIVKIGTVSGDELYIVLLVRLDLSVEGKKTLWEKEKCRLPAISSFFTLSSETLVSTKTFFFLGVYMVYILNKSENATHALTLFTCIYCLDITLG